MVVVQGHIAQQRLLQILSAAEPVRLQNISITGPHRIQGAQVRGNTDQESGLRGLPRLEKDLALDHSAQPEAFWDRIASVLCRKS